MARHQRSNTARWGKPPRRLAAQRKAKAAVRSRRRESSRASQLASVQGTTRSGPGRRRLPALPLLGAMVPGLGRLAGLGLVAALLASLAFLFLDDGFYVESSEITGATYSSREEIFRASGVQDYSLFWVDATAAEQRVEQLPFVKRARVWPLLPNKVHIDVIERQPVLLWQANGQASWVDSGGVALPVTATNYSLPVLIDLDGSSLRSPGLVDPQLVAAVLQLTAQLPEVKRVAWSQDRGLHFMTPDGTLVILGQNARLAERVRQLVALKAQLAAEGKQAKEIDLRLDDGYFMKLAP